MPFEGEGGVVIEDSMHPGNQKIVILKKGITLLLFQIKSITNYFQLFVDIVSIQLRGKSFQIPSDLVVAIMNRSASDLAVFCDC